VKDFEIKRISEKKLQYTGIVEIRTRTGYVIDTVVLKGRYRKLSGDAIMSNPYIIRKKYDLTFKLEDYEGVYEHSYPEALVKRFSAKYATKMKDIYLSHADSMVVRLAGSRVFLASHASHFIFNWTPERLRKHKIKVYLTDDTQTVVP
jgi:hypothetical protein